MRFVLKYTISDGCTFSCEETLPVEYTSKDAFLTDLEKAAFKYISTGEDCFVFTDNSKRVYAYRFVENGMYYEPYCLISVDEWFNP